MAFGAIAIANGFIALRFARAFLDANKPRVRGNTLEMLRATSAHTPGALLELDVLFKLEFCPDNPRHAMLTAVQF